MSSNNSDQNNIKDLHDSLNDFIWSVTYRYPDGEKTLFSDSVYQITGYTQEEIQSLPGQYISLIFEEDLQLFKNALADLENNLSHSTTQVTYRIVTKTGAIIWLKEKIKTSRDEKGFVVKLNKIAVDITDLKDAEAKLKGEIYKLRELNQAKDKFISIVSHDLRSPFTTLLGFSEILLNETNMPLDEQTEYLQFIYDASKNQLQMINNLLDWSRLQTGRVKVEPIRIHLKSLVSNCISSFTGETVRKNIDVVNDVDAKYYIEADERYIENAFMNLLSNAIKFSEERSVIEVTANDFSKGNVELIFRDQGIGIPEDQQHKLFKIDEKFAREGTKGEKGTGLGLTLVNEIIEKHYGKIWFYSRVGEGSEFHVVIPEAKNVILLIEDDRATRKLYRKKISEVYPDFTVLEADNGYDAIKLLSNTVPSIIITDHDMPLMNGLQFIEAIRNRESNIPIIVISAVFSDDIKIKYNRLGVTELLYKPLNYDELVNRISSSLL